MLVCENMIANIKTSDQAMRIFQAQLDSLFFLRSNLLGTRFLLKGNAHINS